MTVMLVDSSRMALERAVADLTLLNAAVTVVMQSSPAAAVNYTMYNPVDMIFSPPRAVHSEANGAGWVLSAGNPMASLYGGAGCIHLSVSLYYHVKERYL